MHRRLLVMLTVTMFLLAGCVERDSDGPESAPASGDDQTAVADDTAGDDVEADNQATGDDAELSDPAPPPSSTEVDTATQSISAFGFDMLKGLASNDSDENVITSPYSAAVLLTMLLSGADGETREAIGNTLHLDDAFDPEITSQHQHLAEYLTSADPDVDLAIANSLWANEGTPFENAYLTEMEDELGATAEEIDLGSEAAVDEIDEWVSEQTRERIEEMAEDLGVPDPNLVLILLNAVYFLGDWTDPFDPDNTSDGTFTTSDGTEVEVPLMSKDDTHLHTTAEGFEMVRLPYGNEERFAMDVLLPVENTDIHQFRDDLEVGMWREAADRLGETRVDVTFPKFELEYSTEGDLNDVLHDLGMGIAYTGEADFTPMSSVAPFLSTVVQKTYIRVDEEGTEAAAVTGGVMDESAPPQFWVDRPFVFLITDTETDTVLFLGQVTDPSE